MHLLGNTKWVVGAFARPILNQIAKMGTRGAKFDKERFAFDVLMRSATHTAGHSTNIFGLDINPYKAFLRGIGSGIGRFTYG